MEPNVTFDRTIVTVESGNEVHVLVELTAPAAPVNDRPPLDVVLVLDRSGSMHGAPLEGVIAATTQLLRLLGPDDRIGVVAFDNTAELVLGLDPHNPDTASLAIRRIRPGGSTNLSAGWLKGLELLQTNLLGTGRRPEALARIVVLTDGRANCGVTKPDELTAMIAGGTGTQVTTTTIGFGERFDEALLSRLADAGAGNDYWCAGADNAPEIFNDEFEGLSSVVAQNLSVEIRTTDNVVNLGILNEYPVTFIDGGAQVALGDAYGSEQRRVVARLALSPTRLPGALPLGEIVLRWAEVAGTYALHTTTVPIGIGVSTDPDAPDPDADRKVTEHVMVLTAAAQQREALELIDRGDLERAAEQFTLAADLLAATGGDPDEIAELRRDVERLRRQDWDRTSSKRQWSSMRQNLKGRKRRYD